MSGPDGKIPVTADKPEQIPWNPELFGTWDLSVFDYTFEEEKTDIFPFYNEKLGNGLELKASLRFLVSRPQMIIVEVVGFLDSTAEFRIDIDPSGEHAPYEIKHRLVTSQNEGISGSALWKKTEAIFLKLFDSGTLDQRLLSLQSRNFDVIEFAERNGFQPNEESTVKLADIRDNPDDYKELSFESKYSEQGVESRKYFISKEKYRKNKEDGRSEDYEETMMQLDCVRVRLEKDITALEHNH